MALQLITIFLHSWRFFWQNLRNWPELWYYIKVDSQRTIIFINQWFQSSYCESISKVKWPRKEKCNEFFWFFFSRSMYWNYHEENSASCLNALERRQVQCTPKYMCIDPSWNCRSEDIFNLTQIVFKITYSILYQLEAVYWFASEPFWRLCTWRFTYSKGNLKWCRRRYHLFSLLHVSRRDNPYHSTFLIICSRNWSL